MNPTNAKRARLETITDIYFTLRNTFHNEEFRGNQEDIIRAAIAGHDIFVLLPTGHGKSLTFQLPAVAIDHGCTLVISPLLALMEAQVKTLQQLGIQAATLNSLVPLAERRKILDDLVCGHPRTRLLYVSPELCATESFRKVIAKLAKNNELNRVVIDEAHCCMDWHGFRSQYRELGYFKKNYPNMPITALTATAPPAIALGIKKILCLTGPQLKVFTTSINRSNLHYEVRFLEQRNIIHDIISFLKDYQERRVKNGSSSSGSGIIYCRRRNTTEWIAGALQKEGIKAHPFHSEINKNEKSRTLNNWVNNHPNYQVIVATIAFGMGIDKPDCRFVIHYDLPNDVQSYYQACGRAGRDNKAARCILYYSREDGSLLASLRGDNREEENQSTTHKDGFRKLVEFCESINACRHLLLASYFGENVPATPSTDWCDRACDFCKDPIDLRHRAKQLTELWE